MSNQINGNSYRSNLISILPRGEISTTIKKSSLTPMPVPVSGEPGIPDLLWRLQFQRDVRRERLQRGLTKMMKDVENVPFIEPSQNSKRKA